MLDAFAELIRWHLDNGADGICVAGDNGESWALTLDERRALAETAVRDREGPGAGGGRGERDHRAAVDCPGRDGGGGRRRRDHAAAPVVRARRAACGRSPARYGRVAAAVPLPILAYNSPRRTGLNMDLATLDAILRRRADCRAQGILARLLHTTRVIERFAGRFSVMMGPGRSSSRGRPRRRRLHLQRPRAARPRRHTASWPWPPPRRPPNRGACTSP